MKFGRRSRSELPPLVQMAVEEAADLGFDGPNSYDPVAKTLSIDSLGKVVLGPFMERCEGLTEAQQRPKMRSAIGRAIRAMPRAVAPEHENLAPELQEAILRHQTHLATAPNDPGSIQAIARIERAAGVAGWQQRMLEAIEIYRDWAAGQVDGPGSSVGAANLLRMIGQHDEAVATAEAIMPHIRTTWSEPSFNPGAVELCNALLLAGRRAELPDVAKQFGQPQIGPRWWPICTAAGAAEAGDRETLAREAIAMRRLAEAEPIDTGGSELSDRDLAEILEQWLSDLS